MAFYLQTIVTQTAVRSAYRPSQEEAEDDDDDNGDGGYNFNPNFPCAGKAKREFVPLAYFFHAFLGAPDPADQDTCR